MLIDSGLAINKCDCFEIVISSYQHKIIILHIHNIYIYNKIRPTEEYKLKWSDLQLKRFSLMMD